MSEKESSIDDGAELSDASRISLAVADHVVKVIASGSVPDGPAGSDPDAAIDGVLMALALIIEQAPECSTPRALRSAAENYGKRLAHHAKVARALFEESGIHPIAEILASSPPAGSSVIN